MNRVQVRQQILTCKACALHATCRSPVPFRGPSPNSLMVIGEAPGKKEDEEGKPFVGPSGALATSWLGRAGISPDSIAWANVVSCFPNRTPTSQEVIQCGHNRDAQINLVRPSHVLLFGGVALSAWWNLRIGVLRGSWWKGTVEGLDYRPWFLATWHPSAVLRNRTLEPEAIRDVMKFKITATNNLYVPPPFLCIDCGDYADVWRDHTGKDVTNLPGEESDGSLAWCQKHDDFRMGKTGRGRSGNGSTSQTETTPTRGRKRQGSSKSGVGSRRPQQIAMDIAREQGDR